jgi:type VI secretion system secreted protein VgrG
MRLVSNAVEDGALVLKSVRGREGIGQLYELELTFHAMVEDPEVVERARELLMSASAAVVWPDDRRHWGVFSSIELVSAEREVQPIYKGVLVPRVWYATQTRRTRVFLDRTAPAIVVSILEEMGMRKDDGDFVLKLVETHVTREYTVQYEETDWAFICRLLEDEGISLYFVQGEESEGIVLTDHADGFVKSDEELSYARFNPGANAPPAVFSLLRSTHVVPRQVVLVDHDWRSPSMVRTAPAPVLASGNGLQILTRERFRDEQAGHKRATLRAQELASKRDRFEVVTNVPTLKPGDGFGVIDHVIPSLDGRYLILERTFEQEADRPFRAELTCIREGTPFRPARVTPRPSIDGVLFATIDAPDEVEAGFLDEHGRYKVILPFDTASREGGRASSWIRRAQPHAGAGYGFHFPLRAGTEVLLAHVGGDPDRPVIVGAIPNVETPSPVVGKNATTNLIRTASGVQIELEDEALRS